MSSNIRLQRICQHCGAEFTAKTTVTKYCGDSCAKKAYKARKRAEKLKASNKQTKLVKIKPVENLNIKPFLSIAETCQLVGISRSTLHRMVKRGELLVGKIGRRTIIRRSDVNQLFEQEIHIVKEQPKELKLADCYYIGEIQKKHSTILLSVKIYLKYKRGNIVMSPNNLLKLYYPKYKIPWQ